MIILQPQIDLREVKIDWYWADKKPDRDDGTLQQVYPFFVMKESGFYLWEGVDW